MITAGKHVAKATGEYDFGTADTGTEQVAIEFEILEGDDAGSFITWFGYFTEKTSERTVEALRNAGWQGDDISTLEGLGSRRVTLVIGHEEDLEGKLRAKVQWVNRLGGGGVKLKKPMDDGAKRRFAARMKSLALSKPALPPDDPATIQRTNGSVPSNGNGNGSNPVPREPGADDISQNDIPPHDDEEIPF